MQGVTKHKGEVGYTTKPWGMTAPLASLLPTPLSMINVDHAAPSSPQMIEIEILKVGEFLVRWEEVMK